MRSTIIPSTGETMCCTAKARCLITLSYPVAVAYVAYLKAQGFTATVHAYGRAKWRVTVSKIS